MSAHIAGAGWVTPLGSGVDEVWDRLMNGDQAQTESIADAASSTSYQACKVPASALAGVSHPRLRRASAISRFAASAGLAAIKDAQDRGLTIDPARTAIVFAISNGGVIYTRRFYHDIVGSGAGSASPILFPETVFNAPASHLAALLGISGQTYTLVGDGSVGLSALNMAEALLADEALDGCLVVGAEEIDWLLCDAYARWRLLRRGRAAAKDKSNSGMVLSEGAGAILLSRTGSVRIDRSHAAIHYEHRRALKSRLKTVLERIGSQPTDAVVGSSNGTFIDSAEKTALHEMFPEAPFYAPKWALGESVGAGGIWQTIVAAKALQTQKLPPSGSSQEPRGFRSTEAVIISCGLNQGVSALRLAT
jgi:3-oxoacyl-[acyl-carrier-protein] synthase II